MGQGASTPPSRKGEGKPKQPAAKPKKPKKHNDEEDEEDKQLRAQQRDADAAAMAAQAQAQTELMLFNQQFNEGVDDDENGGLDFDPDVNINDDVDLEEDVSLNSEDYKDEQILQGLRDLDDELEEEFNQKVATMREEIRTLQSKALACTREDPPDKEKAKQYLLAAKQKEKEVEETIAQHSKPISLQIDELTEQIATMTETIAAKKQESIAALKGGDKPTALEHLKQAKLLEPQLEELKEKLKRLEEEKENALRKS
ncbi:hypothetical protein AGDE_13612 [Angomonas deanei]|uniref:Uncharacterized protein n=1 Tax=Angomonas deanei TaxID=59799 RepID=A0A7G2C683_9TRYP|nr:hypothetical protein AGDE_13612 [Angomonas deanei]CAD2215236.1 hypothetical protein, conserved [Angomonas deanei]|eukprot:EPY22029.1 hypothetical protein AGDE_13612 [Angomonas deanei]